MGGDIISSRISDAERIARYKALQLTPEQEAELLAYDKAVEADKKTEYDLPPDKAKIAQKFAHAGTRKAPTAYKFTPRQRKPNATKGGIIAELAEFLEKNSQFSIADLSITNKERQIAFSIGGDSFELTLVQKRKPKK
jgi:hypothetical protein|nr:MAG TPA: hypothetical protein [Caudoviricetes sp.]